MRISSINDIFFWIIKQKYCIIVSSFKSPLNMKRFIVTLFLSSVIYSGNAQKLYDDALSYASYALAHSKNAYNSNNVYHTQEFADKAIEAFEKVENIADQCGCLEANETSYQAKEDMASSVNQDTYERSRFYAKRAKDLARRLLEELTYCQANPEDYPYPDSMASAEDNEIALASEDVSNKQQELEERKRQLELEQKRLEKQIADQDRLRVEIEQKRAAELKQQTLMKSQAEKALKKLETALQELSILLNKKAMFDAKNNYSRSDSDLKNESLDDTKSFYVNRAKELTNKAVKKFAGYDTIDD